MSNRVTDIEVKEIIDTEVAAAPFIKAANLIVTDQLSADFGEDHLKEIERWLAAHFIAIFDPRVKQEKTGDASYTYQGTTGIGRGLDFTPYGQQVKVLDTTGKLSSLGKRRAILTVH